MDTKYDNCGRHKKADEDEVFRIVSLAVSDPFFNISDITNELDNLSYTSVREILKENDLRSHIAATKTLLTEARKQKRVRYCQSMINSHDWPSVVFCDESMFCTAKLGSKRVL